MSHSKSHESITLFFSLKMPDVVSEAATLSLSQMEDLIEDDHHPVHGDPMLSHHLLNSPRSPSSPTSSLHSNDLNLNNHSNARFVDKFEPCNR